MTTKIQKLTDMVDQIQRQIDQANQLSFGPYSDPDTFDFVKEANIRIDQLLQEIEKLNNR